MADLVRCEIRVLIYSAPDGRRRRVEERRDDRHQRVAALDDL